MRKCSVDLSFGVKFKLSSSGNSQSYRPKITNEWLNVLWMSAISRIMILFLFFLIHVCVKKTHLRLLTFTFFFLWIFLNITLLIDFFLKYICKNHLVSLLTLS